MTTKELFPALVCFFNEEVVYQEDNVMSKKLWLKKFEEYCIGKNWIVEYKPGHFYGSFVAVLTCALEKKRNSAVKLQQFISFHILKSFWKFLLFRCTLNMNSGYILEISNKKY